MNDTQKEIVILACRELCVSRGEPPCYSEAVASESWTACATCGRIAALATQKLVNLGIGVQHALEAMDGAINPSNYNHDDVCNLNSRLVEAYGVLEEAMKEGAA